MKGLVDSFENCENQKYGKTWVHLVTFSDFININI